MKANPDDVILVNEALKELGDYEWKGTVRVRHIAEVIGIELGPYEIEPYITRKIKANIAIHYGCHLIKPTRIRDLDSSEAPSFLEDLIEMLGGTSLDFRQKLSCCGAGGEVLGSQKDTSMLILKEKFRFIP